MSNYLKLICEHDYVVSDTLELIVEKDNRNSAKEVVKFRGPMIVCGVKNANGRIYDTRVMQEAVKTYINEYVNQNRALGEMNHPDSVDIDYNNVCHKLLKLEQDGDVWIGTSQVLLGTPRGDLLAALLHNGVKVGVSTRGVGNVGSNNIVDKFSLIAIDVVANPSGPGAFVNGICESKNFMLSNHGEIVEVAYTTLEKSLANLPVNRFERDAKMLSAFNEFIKKI